VSLGLNVTEKLAPVFIALEVRRLNRVEPTAHIIDAMSARLNEPEPNKSRPYGVVNADVN